MIVGRHFPLSLVLLPNICSSSFTIKFVSCQERLGVNAYFQNHSLGILCILFTLSCLIFNEIRKSGKRKEKIFCKQQYENKLHDKVIVVLLSYHTIFFNGKDVVCISCKVTVTQQIISVNPFTNQGRIQASSSSCEVNESNEILQIGYLYFSSFQFFCSLIAKQVFLCPWFLGEQIQILPWMVQSSKNTNSCLKGLCFVSIRTQKSTADPSECRSVWNHYCMPPSVH